MVSLIVILLLVGVVVVVIDEVNVQDDRCDLVKWRDGAWGRTAIQVHIYLAAFAHLELSRVVLECLANVRSLIWSR